MISDHKAKEKAVILQIRISPKQAERLEKIYRIFGVTKSDVTEIALEEFFSSYQTIDKNKFKDRG